MDESCMTIVDFRKVGNRDEPFINAKQVYQVFFM